MAVSVGAGTIPLTPKPAARVADWPSGLRTVTSQAPGLMPVRLMLQVICVGLTVTTFVAATVGCPERLNSTVAGEPKPVPARLVMASGPLLAPLAGVIEVTWGAGVDAAARTY